MARGLWSALPWDPNVGDWQQTFRTLLGLGLVVLLAVLPNGAFAESAIRNRQSAIGNPYLFQGARYDAETGFYYCRNRYYDPRTGRFLQRDPVWDPQNLANAYTFAGNSPASSADPTGEGFFIPMLIIAALIGAGSFAHLDYLEESRSRSVLEKEPDLINARRFNAAGRGAFFGATAVVVGCVAIKGAAGVGIALIISTGAKGFDLAVIQGDVEEGMQWLEASERFTMAAGGSGRRINPRLDPFELGPRSVISSRLPRGPLPTEIALESILSRNMPVSGGLLEARADRMIAENNARTSWQRAMICRALREIAREQLQDMAGGRAYTEQEAAELIGRINEVVRALGESPLGLEAQSYEQLKENLATWPLRTPGTWRSSDPYGRWGERFAAPPVRSGSTTTGSSASGSTTTPPISPGSTTVTVP